MPLAHARRRSSRASRRCSASRTSDPRRAGDAVPPAASPRRRGSRRAPPSAPVGSGNSICGRRTGCCARRQRVVRVRVAQLGDAADVAGVQPRHLDALLALRRPTRWLSFSAPLARGVVQLVAVGDRAREEAEERSRRRRAARDCVLKTCAANGASSFAWISTVASPSAPLNACSSSISNAFGISSTIVESTALRAVVQLAETQKSGKSSMRFIASFIAGDRLVARDLAAFEVALEQRVVGGGDRLDQLRVVAVELRLRPRRECRSPRTRPSSRRACRLCAFFVKRLTTPWKSAPSPTGTSIGMTLLVRRVLICW